MKHIGMRAKVRGIGTAAGHQHCAICHPDDRGPNRALEKRRVRVEVQQQVDAVEAAG